MSCRRDAPFRVVEACKELAPDISQPAGSEAAVRV
jgi:hypothetical protein